MLELPDLAGVIMTYIKESTEVNNIDVDGRIYVTWPKAVGTSIKVPPFYRAILIKTGLGGPGSIGSGLERERVDICCYGNSEMTAHDLWRKLDWYLLPKDERRKTSFTRFNTRVSTIAREGGPLRLVDSTMGNWPYTQGTYIFTYSGVPVE